MQMERSSSVESVLEWLRSDLGGCMTLLTASGKDKRGMRTKPGGEDAAATCVELGFVSGAFVSP